MLRGGSGASLNHGVVHIKISDSPCRYTENYPLIRCKVGGYERYVTTFPYRLNP